jgi:hypothetical protein
MPFIDGGDGGADPTAFGRKNFKSGLLHGSIDSNSRAMLKIKVLSGR